MFRLMKLGFYALIGYGIYEFFLGLTGNDRGRRQSYASGNTRRDLNRALNRSTGRTQTLTGPGIGAREATLDRDGGVIPHQVGRGVVHQ